MISASRLQQLRAMIDDGTSDLFYSWPEWENIRRKVLQMDHKECQLCKARHRYRRAVIVHHVQHLKDRPDLALSLTDPSTGDRQLISVCRACHEEQHPERRHSVHSASVAFTTPERWE